MNDFISDPSYCPLYYIWDISNLSQDPNSAITRTGTNFDFYYNSQLDDLTQMQTVNVKAISFSYSLTPRLHPSVV